MPVRACSAGISFLRRNLIFRRQVNGLQALDLNSANRIFVMLLCVPVTDQRGLRHPDQHLVVKAEFQKRLMSPMHLK
jgi:hypothetical protein